MSSRLFVMDPFTELAIMLYPESTRRAMISIETDIIQVIPF